MADDVTNREVAKGYEGVDEAADADALAAYIGTLPTVKGAVREKARRLILRYAAYRLLLLVTRPDYMGGAT